MSRQPTQLGCERARAWLVDRLGGAIGEPEEGLLALHLESCADCRREAAELAETWALLGELPEPAPSAQLRRRFHGWLAGEIDSRPARVSPGRLPRFGRLGQLRQLRWAAALAASLVLGVLVGSRRDQGEIDGLRADVKALNQLVALSLLKQSSASERLLGVAQGRETAARDDTVVRALLATATEDENANVRLAAIDALSPIARRTDVRDALLAAFSRDTSPLVQAAIAATLLDAEDGETRRRLAAEVEAAGAPDRPLDPGVREYVRLRMAQGATT